MNDVKKTWAKGLAVWSLSLLALGSWTAPAVAQMAVVDARAIAQLILQVRAMRDQLTTARESLREAQETLRAMSGGRGLENILPREPRNYLPADARALNDVFQGASAEYRALADALESLLRSNAVLDAPQVAALPRDYRELLDTARRDVALAQTVARDSLRVTSARFEALQRLIAALASADDPKVVWDLQARIAAEQAMLMNEQSKLVTLFEATKSDQAARRQQKRETAIRDIGRWQQLTPLGL